MAIIKFLTAFLLVQTSLFAQESDQQWNRWTNEKFTILSIDNKQGEWLSNNVIKIKSWSMARWGFPDIEFTHECKILCVPNKALLKKYFNLDSSKFEAKYENNQLQQTVMWLCLEDSPGKTIPPFITQACLAEFEYQQRIKLGLWAKNGISLLNSDTSDIKQRLASLASPITNDKPMYFGDTMFTMTEEVFYKQPLENQDLFNCESVALCLMLRKEFGEAKLQGFLIQSARNNPEKVLQSLYYFSGYSEFDKSFKRYMTDISSDIMENKTPDSYLEIKNAK